MRQEREKVSGEINDLTADQRLAHFQKEDGIISPEVEQNKKLTSCY